MSEENTTPEAVEDEAVEVVAEEEVVTDGE